MKKLTLLLVLAGLVACDSTKQMDERAALLDSLERNNVKQLVISEGVISDIIQQIPSPLEISFLIKESGTNYNNKLLNSPKNLSKYNNNYKKALNLGVYGTDLGYTNIYNQNQDAIFYLDAIRDLANGLSIGQFFDFGTFKRLATKSDNLDSLLLVTTQNFNNINDYLQKQRRANLSILFLTGGWLEAMHIMCQVSINNPESAALQEKIGEQKIILDSIKQLLAYFKNTDPNIEILYQDIMELDKVYSNIRINHTYAEPTVEEVNGMSVIRDNSTTTIDITEEQVKEIRRITELIRNKIIG
jgi:hypothetical protein